MLSFILPNPGQSRAFLEGQQRLPFSYAQQHATEGEIPVAGFNNDRLRVAIGRGSADFERAKQAVHGWQMFPNDWTRIFPGDAPLQPGTVVAMYARFAGIWWRNACRILYTVDAADRFGFAYGTLPGHIECGEELFLVEIGADGVVWYSLRAFSRPRHWLAWLAYPLVRLLQARFRRHSAVQMQAFVQQNLD